MKQILDNHYRKSAFIALVMIFALALLMTSCTAQKGWYKSIRHTGCQSSRGYAGY